MFGEETQWAKSNTESRDLQFLSVKVLSCYTANRRLGENPLFIKMTVHVTVNGFKYLNVYKKPNVNKSCRKFIFQLNVQVLVKSWFEN